MSTDPVLDLVSCMYRLLSVDDPHTRTVLRSMEDSYRRMGEWRKAEFMQAARTLIGETA